MLTAIDEAVGVYGTSPHCYLSALARMEGFGVAEFDRAVEVDRSLVRVRAMRYSAHAFPRELLLVALAATRREVERAVGRRARGLGDGYPEWADKVEKTLSQGPLTNVELKDRVDPGRSLGQAFNLVLAKMLAESKIVRATTTGGWRSNRFTYALWSEWLPTVDPRALPEAEARHQLVSRYVAAYGPVELADVSWWAAWTKKDTLEAVEGIDLHAQGSALQRLPGVRLLPPWDVLMVAYRNRDRLFDPEHAPFIYDAMGNATSVVLDAGCVVGVWDLGKRDDPLSVRVAPLGKWPERRWHDVELQVERIRLMLNGETAEVVRCDRPLNLPNAPRNTFLSPLARAKGS